MNNAAHNMLEDLADVNNLWRYPTELYSPGWNVMPIKVKYWQMMRYANNGLGGNNTDQTCRFTKDSISGLYAASYNAAIALDLGPGKYTMEFDATGSSGTLYFQNWIVDNDTIAYSDYKPAQYSFRLGHNVFSFETLSGFCIVMLFPGSPNWATLTNIRLREGAL